ncbi:MAG: glutamate--tRNA ligase [Epsilonproteobacteria bacterium]|nr:glutamate--tRNA ligase [Campylobacterota bacterium]
MVVTRFAPSPTGYLHIGGLRTALYNYLWARKNHGKFLLRIEDTDLKRNSKEAAKAIEEAFNWTGLSYDGDPIYQSQRFDIYKEYIQKLLDENKAYYCYMTKEELDELRKEQMARKERPRYDGRYRDFKGEPPKGVEPVVRIKVPQGETIEFEDGIKGKVSVKVDDVMDDFIIARSDGTPTYNFVVAIDDALMGITDVIRGDDHLSNTPKQIVVYKALGFDIPKFYHVPMILNPQGKKLSKRDGAMDVMEYKRMGYLPEALLNFLVRLGWSYGDQEIFSMEEMLRLFDPHDINKSASAYNAEKLLWLNAHYIKNAPYERLIKELEFFGVHIDDHDKKEILIDSLKERSKTLKEMAEAALKILKEPASYDEKAVKKFLKEENIEILKKFKEALKERENLHLPVDYEEFVKEFLDKNELKLKNLAQPLRIALVGDTVSPSIYDVLSIVGKEGIIKRIEKLLNHLQEEN